MFPDVAFILLQLLLHCLTILLRVHAHFGGGNGVATPMWEGVEEVLRTMFGAGVLTGKKVASVVGK